MHPCAGPETQQACKQVCPHYHMATLGNDRLAWRCLDIIVVTGLPVQPYVCTGTWQGHDQACLHQYGRYTNSGPHASRRQHWYTEDIGTDDTTPTSALGPGRRMNGHACATRWRCWDTECLKTEVPMLPFMGELRNSRYVNRNAVPSQGGAGAWHACEQRCTCPQVLVHAWQPAHANTLCCWGTAGMRMGVHMMSEDGTKTKQTFRGESAQPSETLEDGTVLNRCHPVATL